MAVALPDVVPRVAVPELYQRRCVGGLPDRHLHGPAAARAVHPWPAGHPAGGAALQAGLAVLVQPARQRGAVGSGCRARARCASELTLPALVALSRAGLA